MAFVGTSAEQENRRIEAGAVVAQAQATSTRFNNRVRYRSSALYAAAKSGRADEVRLLLSHGLDPNSGGEDGFTPLMTASEAGHVEVVEVLLDHEKCDLNFRNNYGQTALCLAAINGREHVALRLLQEEHVVVESTAGGLSIAEKTRRAGFTRLADILASATKDQQVGLILHAVTEGFASGDFDSLTQRIETLSSQLAVARQKDYEQEHLQIADDRLCTVCLSQNLEMVIMPCFHACLCEESAGKI